MHYEQAIKRDFDPKLQKQRLERLTHEFLHIDDDLSLEDQSNEFLEDDFLSESEEQQPTLKKEQLKIPQKNPWVQEVVQVKQVQIQKPRSASKILESKATQRKEVNQLIRQRHEERKKQQELQKQQEKQLQLLEIQRKKEEEYNRIQAKKKSEKEAIEKRQREMEEEQFKSNIAHNHYCRQLQKYHILLPLLKNHDRMIMRTQLADEHFIRTCQRKIITYIKTSYLIVQKEKEFQENIKMNIARQHYNSIIKFRMFMLLKINLQQSALLQSKADKVRDKYLQRNIMTAWYIQLPDLRIENLKLEKVQNNLIETFRKAKLLQQYYNGWRMNAKSNILERNKEINKNQLWAKVNQWLMEFEEQ